MIICENIKDVKMPRYSGIGKRRANGLITRPREFKSHSRYLARVSQLAEELVLETNQCGFDSHPWYNMKRASKLETTALLQGDVAGSDSLARYNLKASSSGAEPMPYKREALTRYTLVQIQPGLQ